jgi:hypothetical protein
MYPDVRQAFNDLCADFQNLQDDRVELRACERCAAQPFLVQRMHQAMGNGAACSW